MVVIDPPGELNDTVELPPQLPDLVKVPLEKLLNWEALPEQIIVAVVPLTTISIPT